MTKLTPQTLLRLTADMPMKQINLTAELLEIHTLCGESVREVVPVPMPYLQRYYAGTFRDGSDLLLHRFLSNDGDRHVHSHPFEFQSVMLCGGYTEEFLTADGSKDHRVTLPNSYSNLPDLLEEFLVSLKKNFRPQSGAFLHAAGGAQNEIDVYDWHRICAVNDDTWTAVIVKPQRLPKWFFKNDDGDLVDMVGSPRDWWKNYKTRPDCDIARDDNHV